jgi:general secretion pathway protein A
MYQSFFGFSSYPFHITPDPRFLYLSHTHQEALAHLRYGIEQRKGFMAITGEVGCGKTLLCRTLLDSLDEKIFETAWFYNPQGSFEQVLRSMARDLDIALEGENPLLDQINTALLAKARKKKEVLLLVDEAQNLSYGLLEQIRLLSNLETHQRKLIQIILVGQPELKVKLNQPQLRQLKQRILVYYNLDALDVTDTKRYINHRLSLVSTRPGSPRFTYGAFRKIFRYSCGVPRVINDVCDKALLSAFGRLSLKVEKQDVKKAVDNIERLTI